MANSIEKYIVDLNQLYRVKNNVIGNPPELNINNIDIKIAYTKKSGRVFNKALYHLSVQDVLIQADGTAVEAPVDSYKTDFDGVKTLVSYSGARVELDPNETELEKKGVFTVTQEISGLQVVGNYTQAPDSSSKSYSNLKVTSVNYMYIPASGGFAYITIGYTMTEKTVYASGKEEEKTVGGSTSDFTSITGKSLVSGCTFNRIDGSVYAPSLDKTLKESTAVAQVTAVSISVNNLTASWTGTAYCYQFENTRTAGGTSYSVTCVADSNSCTAASTNIVFRITAKKVTKYTYTSGSTGSEESNATASVSTNLGTLSSSSVTGSGTVTLSLTANTSTTSSRKATVTATAGGVSDSDYVTQSKDEVTEYWGTPTINSISCSDVGASGSASQIYAAFTQYKYKGSVASGLDIIDTVKTTVAVSSASGSTVANGGAISGTTVKASSLGTTVQARRIVFTITSVTITYNGVSGTSSGKSCSVYQAANTRSVTSSAYSVTCTASASTMANIGGTITISVTAKRTDTYTYTSGSTKNETVNDTAALTKSAGTLSTTSITGSGTATLTIPENYSESKKNYTVTATLGGKTSTATITQEAAVYELSSLTLGMAAAAGGTATMTILSTRNGNPQTISTSNVVVSGLSGVSVTSVTHDGNGEHTIKLSVPANTSTSSRTFTMTVTQPNSLKTLTKTITQSGASVAKKKVAVLLTPALNAAMTSVSYTLQFSATDTSQYTGGTLNNVNIQLNTKMDGTGTVVASKKIADSISVSSGGTSTSYIGFLSNSTGSSLIYVLVYYDYSVQYSTMPMLTPEIQT